MNDLISRQASIDAVNDITKWYYETYRETRPTAIAVIDALEQLPSVQSEIIRCKDCKHFEYDHPYIIQGMPVLGHEVCNAWGDGCKTDENGYCFMAERRNDE